MHKTLNIKFFKKIFLFGCLISNSIFPQSGKLLKKAISAMEAGLFQEAIKQIEIAQSREPNNAEVYKLKALLHEAINETGKAINAWNNCINNTENNDLINEAKIHLKNLQEY